MGPGLVGADRRTDGLRGRWHRAGADADPAGVAGVEVLHAGVQRHGGLVRIQDAGRCPGMNVPVTCRFVVVGAGV